MLTQIIANVLIAVIAAGMTFQLATLTRYAARIVSKRRAARPRPAVRAKAVQPVLRRVRRRDYRLALRAARMSVSA